MNIFRTNPDPVISADELCNIHLTKMICEYAQLMSCSHRALDGFGPLWLKHDGNDRKWWVHHTDSVDANGKAVKLLGYVLLAGVNMSHPALTWVCEGQDNYTWVYTAWLRMLDNFARVRGKPHEYERLREVLKDFPKKLPAGGTPPAKWVYPEFRHIQPVEAAYHAHINHKLTLPKFRNAVFEVKTPEWLDKVPPKSYTQTLREQRTGVDEGPPKPAMKVPKLKLGTPPDIIKAANTVVSVEKEKEPEKAAPIKVTKSVPKFSVPSFKPPK